MERGGVHRRASARTGAPPSAWLRLTRFDWRWRSSIPCTTLPALRRSSKGNPIQRYFQDIHVISQHTQGRLAHYELIGKHALGLKVDQARF